MPPTLLANVMSMSEAAGIWDAAVPVWGKPQAGVLL